MESATRKEQGTRTLAEEGLFTLFVGPKFVVRQEGGRGIEVKGDSDFLNFECRPPLLH